MTTSLVIQTAFLGDVVLTTPLIAALAARGPVDVVTTPQAAGLLANNPHVRTVIPYDKHGMAGGIPGFVRIARRLRRSGGYDTAYLAQASVRSGALAFAAGIPARAGFTTSAGRMFYTQRIPFRKDLHHAARLLQLSGDASAPAGDPRPRLYPGITERAAVDRLLALHDGAGGAPLVALAPGSVWATKRWPYYAELAREVATHARIVVVGSSDDAALAADVARAAGSAAINAAGALTLLGSAELIRRCRALVTNDSAPQHLAAAVGTPTITLFGPTVPAFGFGPLAPSSVPMGITLDCRPCDPHGPQRCPLGHWRCMRELAVRDVAARVLDILNAA